MIKFQTFKLNFSWDALFQYRYR